MHGQSRCTWASQGITPAKLHELSTTGRNRCLWLKNTSSLVSNACNTSSAVRSAVACCEPARVMMPSDVLTHTCPNFFFLHTSNTSPAAQDCCSSMYMNWSCVYWLYIETLKSSTVHTTRLVHILSMTHCALRPFHSTGAILFISNSSPFSVVHMTHFPSAHTIGDSLRPAPFPFHWCYLFHI